MLHRFQNVSETEQGALAAAKKQLVTLEELRRSIPQVGESVGRTITSCGDLGL